MSPRADTAANNAYRKESSKSGASLCGKCNPALARKSVVAALTLKFGAVAELVERFGIRERFE
ncbi:MAG: hypothetical protein ACXWCP_17190, partial [Burkholderiales bacterium]